MPTRATVDPDPIPDDDVVKLEAAAVLPVHAADAFPDRPAPSNSGVGADVPAAMPLMPAIEVPGLEDIDCADAPMPEHA